MMHIGLLHLVFLAILATFPVLIVIQLRASNHELSGRFRFSRRARVELRWLLGPENMETLQLPRGNYLIGRSPEAHITINHPDISHQHAVLCVRRKATFIMDLNSLNGVKIEALPVTPWTKVKIPDGQSVFLGRDNAFEHRRIS